MRMADRRDDPVATALAVSWVTVAWSTSTGAAAAVVGVLRHSLSVAGLGIVVLIDVASSIVLIWRFRRERSGHPAVDHAERVAHRVAAAALATFGILLAVQAGRNIDAHAVPEQSVLAGVIAAGGVIVLPVLARAKYGAAVAVGSPALRADAHVTAVGAAMAAVTLAGLIVARAWDWWWADPAAALVLAALAMREGTRGLRGSGSVDGQ